MNFLVLLGKELRQQARTHRVLTVGIVFVVFAGMMSPPVAKFAPELVKSLTSSAAPGISIQIPEPTVADATAQFLFEMASPFPMELLESALGKGLPVKPGCRLMIMNASAEAAGKLIHWGTDPNKVHK